MIFLQTLGLKKGASQKEIAFKFKTLSKEWHPDKYVSQVKTFVLFLIIYRICMYILYVFMHVYIYEYQYFYFYFFF